MGLLRALRAPLQPPRHRRVSQPWSYLLLPRNRSLGPAPSIRSVRLGSRGCPSTPDTLGTFGKGGRLRRWWEDLGLLRLGLGIARHAHPAWLGRRVASRHWGVRPGEAGGYAPLPSRDPASPRPPLLPAQTGKAGARLPAAPSVPSPARGGGEGARPRPLVSFAPSVCPHLGFLPLIRCRSVCSRCEASC